jgi:hypothetical protein
MTKLTLRNVVFYLVVSVILGTAISQISFSPSASAAGCCTYGEECSGRTTCCDAFVGQASCSATEFFGIKLPEIKDTPKGD